MEGQAGAAQSTIRVSRSQHTDKEGERFDHAARRARVCSVHSIGDGPSSGAYAFGKCDRGCSARLNCATTANALGTRRNGRDGGMELQQGYFRARRPRTEELSGSSRGARGMHGRGGACATTAAMSKLLT